MTIEIADQDSRVRVDVEATRAMYARIATGHCEECSCNYRGYYVKHRDDAYPESFRELLRQLGIDYRKENETGGICHAAWMLYMGNFDVVGAVEETPAG